MLPGLHRSGDSKPDFGAELDWDHPINESLLALWMFPEEKGGTAFNLVAGTQYALTLLNSPAFGASHRGSTINLSSASSQYLSGGNILNIGLSDGSCAVWFRSTGSSFGILGKSRQAAEAGRWGLRYNSVNGGLEGQFDYGTAKLTPARGGVNDGLWHHAVLTWKRTGNMTLYCDGLLVGAVDISAGSTVNMSTGDLFYLGALADATGTAPGSGWFLNGAVELAAVWNRCLTVEEAGLLYAQPYCMFAGPVVNRYFRPDGLLTLLLAEALSLTDLWVSAVAMVLQEQFSLNDARFLSIAKVLGEAIGFTESCSAQRAGLMLLLVSVAAYGDSISIEGSGDSVIVAGGGDPVTKGGGAT